MSQTDYVFDVIGLGFGPANIAIAGAITESWNQPDYPIKKALFIERHSVFRWHPGMLLPGARMQISFMKDLATLRSPQSPLTFLSYLHSQGRLLKFINRGSTVPTRKEYADYLGWASRYVQEQGVQVKWATEIFALDDGKDGHVVVHAKNLKTGEVNVYKTRNLIISPGGAGNIPKTFSSIYKAPSYKVASGPINRVIHSSAYATSIEGLLSQISATSRPVRIVVVGSGQSAAEVTMDLRERLASLPSSDGQHRVEMLIRKGSLKPSDDSPFANEIFDPESTDAWFSMRSPGVRAGQLREYKSTNYGVVNPKTIDALYEVMYDQHLDTTRHSEPSSSSNSPIIVLRPYTRVLAANQSSTSASVEFTTQHAITSEISTTRYDAVILATGYQRTAWIDLLKKCEIGRYFGLDKTTDAIQTRLAPETELQFSAADSGVSSPMSSTPTSASNTPPTSPSITDLHESLAPTIYVSRKYRLLPQNGAEGEFKPRIYIQGVEEATHGLSDTLLSVLGVRAGEVVGDIVATSN